MLKHNLHEFFNGLPEFFGAGRPHQALASISSTRHRGAPMSRTCTRPVYRSTPGWKNPGLGATKVQVWAARIVCRAAQPESQSKPLGRSTASLGAAAALS